MALSRQEFGDGVRVWPAGWGQDFHNRFYAQLTNENPGGEFTPEWWETFLPNLTRWKATRGASSEAITRAVHAGLPELRDAWVEACAPHLHKDISQVTWAEVAPFANLVARFKPSRAGGHVRSPVFRSKFCHFLAPAIFPVADGALMGLFGQVYEKHFTNVQREWSETSEDPRSELRSQLTHHIGAEPTPGYPFVNKIVELSLAGRRAQRLTR